MKYFSGNIRKISPIKQNKIPRINHKIGNKSSSFRIFLKEILEKTQIIRKINTNGFVRNIICLFFLYSPTHSRMAKITDQRIKMYAIIILLMETAMEKKTVLRTDTQILTEF